MKRLFFLLALLLPSLASATTFYFSECGATAVSGCVAGSDSTGDGSLGNPWKTIDKAWTQWNALPAGSSLLFARGADFTRLTAAVDFDNRNCVKANRCTIGAYSPSWLSATDSGTSTSIASASVTDSTKTWTVNQWVGYSVRMQSAFGSWIELIITSNTSTVLTLGRIFPDTPAVGAAYTIQGKKPVLRGPVSNALITLADSGNMDHNEGVTISNLHLIGDATNNNYALIMVTNDQDYTLIDAVELEHPVGIGVQIDGRGNHTSNTADIRTDFTTVRNSFIHDIFKVGILAGADNVLIESNTFQANGDTGLDHHVYLDDSTPLSPAVSVVLKNNVVRHNTFIEATISGPCVEVALAVHGRKDGLVIEHNFFRETTPATNGACGAISVDAGYSGATYGAEGFSKVVIRGNHVVDFAVGIGIDICRYCTIENNYVYSSVSAVDIYGIRHRSKNFQPTVGASTSTIDCKGCGGGSDDSANADFQPTNIVIRSNTVYFSVPNANAIAISLNGNIADDLTGSGNQLVSNLIFLGTTATTNSACFDTRNIAVAKFTSYDYNLCYTTSASTPKWDWARSNLAANQAVGFDAHSLNVDPSITAPGSSNRWSLAIPTGSAAKNAGHPSRSSRLSFGNIRRKDIPDIGAFEFGASGRVAYPSVWGQGQ